MTVLAVAAAATKAVARLVIESLVKLAVRFMLPLFLGID